MSLPARAFTPPPKVDSAVVRLTPRADPPAPALVDALRDRHPRRLRPAAQDAPVVAGVDLGGERLCEAAGIDPLGAGGDRSRSSGFLALARQLRSRLSLG